MKDRKTEVLAGKARSGLSRRDFMRTAATAGLSVAMANSLWSEARAQTPQSGGTLRLGADGGSAGTQTNAAVPVSDGNPPQPSDYDAAYAALSASTDAFTGIPHAGPVDLVSRRR